MTEAVIKPVHWFLYDNGPSHERVKSTKVSALLRKLLNAISSLYENFINQV